MILEKARRLVENYTTGWIKNDRELIISSLSLNCIIIESHGPIYRGAGKVKEWVTDWIKNGNYVTKWDVTSFYFVKDIAFFEWDFECVVSSKKHKLDGISIVKFKHNKIYYIREYRTTTKGGVAGPP